MCNLMTLPPVLAISSRAKAMGPNTAMAPITDAEYEMLVASQERRQTLSVLVGVQLRMQFNYVNLFRAKLRDEVARGVLFMWDKTNADDSPPVTSTASEAAAHQG